MLCFYKVHGAALKLSVLWNTDTQTPHTHTDILYDLLPLLG